MKQTLISRKFTGFGALATAIALLVSLLIPTAQAATYSLPNAPTNVTSYIGAKGVVVRWTPGAEVEPGVTGYVISAGAGSCPIFVPARNNSVVTMPVVDGQPGGNHKRSQPEQQVFLLVVHRQQAWLPHCYFLQVQRLGMSPHLQR